MGYMVVRRLVFADRRPIVLACLSCVPAHGRRSTMSTHGSTIPFPGRHCPFFDDSYGYGLCEITGCNGRKPKLPLLLCYQKCFDRWEQIAHGNLSHLLTAAVLVTSLIDFNAAIVLQTNCRDFSKVMEAMCFFCTVYSSQQRLSRESVSLMNAKWTAHNHIISQQLGTSALVGLRMTYLFTYVEQK